MQRGLLLLKPGSERFVQWLFGMSNCDSSTECQEIAGHADLEPQVFL